VVRRIWAGQVFLPGPDALTIVWLAFIGGCAVQRAHALCDRCLADAQAFFTDNPIDIGFQPGGLADVQIVYDLTASQSSSGFQFDYAFGTASAVHGPISGAGLPGLIWRAVAYSAGGDGNHGK
jgi:hypothetical protein